MSLFTYCALLSYLFYSSLAVFLCLLSLLLSSINAALLAKIFGINSDFIHVNTYSILIPTTYPQLSSASRNSIVNANTALQAPHIVIPKCRQCLFTLLLPRLAVKCEVMTHKMEAWMLKLRAQHAGQMRQVCVCVAGVRPWCYYQ